MEADAQAAALMEEEEFTGEDATTRVYSIIRDYATERGETTINYAAVERTLLTKGFTQEQIESCLDEYESIDVWKINNKQMLSLIVKTSCIWAEVSSF